jgi:hypothetical protein
VRFVLTHEAAQLPDETDGFIDAELLGQLFSASGASAHAAVRPCLRLGVHG